VNVSFTNNDRTNEFVITINRQISNQPNADSDTDLDTDSDTFNADSDTIRPKITNKQRDIVNFCSVPRSSKEILERVGVTYHSKNIQTYIMSLIEAGYLEMTNPEHPNASNQKYRRSKK
jgi:ATP-dependent DNA helicase RecG